MGVRRGRPVYRIYWWDIEANSGWNVEDINPCLVTTVAFLWRKPSKRQKIPTYIFAADLTDDGTPGGTTKIPECCIHSMEEIARVDIKHWSRA